MEHIISVLVENKFGVLARVAGLFSARGYNIESLSVAPTLDPTTSMITIVTVGDDRIIEQIMKQLNKVVEVLKVVDLTEMRFLDRETAKIDTLVAPCDDRPMDLAGRDNSGSRARRLLRNRSA